MDKSALLDITRPLGQRKQEHLAYVGQPFLVFGIWYLTEIQGR